MPPESMHVHYRRRVAVPTPHPPSPDNKTIQFALLDTHILGNANQQARNMSSLMVGVSQNVQTRM
jgi:hypothetical protein